MEDEDMDSKIRLGLDRAQATGEGMDLKIQLEPDKVQEMGS
jgi:hypothetical protein